MLFIGGAVVLVAGVTVLVFVADWLLTYYTDFISDMEPMERHPIYIFFKVHVLIPLLLFVIVMGGLLGCVALLRYLIKICPFK